MSKRQHPSQSLLDLRSTPRIIGRVIALVKPYKRRLIFATVASLGATVFNLAVPRLLGSAVDQIHVLFEKPTHSVENASLHALLITSLLIIVATGVRGLLQMVSGYNSEHIGQSIGSDLRLAFFEKLQRLGFTYHDTVHSGDLITRGMLDLEGVRGFIENGLQRFVSLALLVALGSSLMFSRDPVMAAVTLSFVPIIGLLAGRMGLKLRRAWTRLQERMSVLTRIMEENLQGIRVVRSFGSKAFELKKFDSAGNEALLLSNERIYVRSTNMTMINAGYYLIMLLVLWIGGHRVSSGHLTIGQLTEFLTFMTLLQLPVRQIGMIMNSLARAVSSGTRLFEVLDLKPTIHDSEDAKDLVKVDGIIRFENVSFSYPTKTEPVLKGISFTVEPGKTLGIVGPSGSGKSTLAHLIPRFYDVTDGKITIDSQDIRNLKLESLRSTVGLIQQDVFLFDDSVRNNVAYACPEAEANEVILACDIAQMHGHIADLPLAYDTTVGERGMGLSGGQRQRLSIARSLVPDASVLIFDDATSAVDASTEQQVRHALRQATQNKATLIISHRISSLMHADEIIVLVDGEIAERGNHEYLVEIAGYYAQLYRAQSEGKSLTEETTTTGQAA